MAKTMPKGPKMSPLRTAAHSSPFRAPTRPARGAQASQHRKMMVPVSIGHLVKVSDLRQSRRLEDVNRSKRLFCAVNRLKAACYASNIFN
jgi:hypothetical protein